jgi:hypothetical protein
MVLGSLGPATLLSLVFVLRSSLHHATPQNPKNKPAKFIEGFLLPGEFDRAVSVITMVYRVPSLKANMFGSQLTFSTRPVSAETKKSEVLTCEIVHLTMKLTTFDRC